MVVDKLIMWFKIKSTYIKFSTTFLLLFHSRGVFFLVLLSIVPINNKLSLRVMPPWNDYEDTDFHFNG